MAKAPDITVVIPTYDREEVLIDSIKDVLAQSHQNLELLVLDQSKNHEPATRDFLNSVTDKRFRYLVIEPPSLPAARNFALQAARAPIVLFLDDDVRLNKQMVHYHLQTFAEKPNLSAVAGRVLQAGFPIKKDVLRFDEYGFSQGVFTATEPGYTNTFPGGNHSIKVADALRVGGYDTRYYGNAFREESDMAARLGRAGLKIYYEPRAELTHLAAQRGGTRAKIYADIHDTLMFYRNELFFTLRTVSRQNLREALRRKYRVYCLSVRHFRAYRRRALFFLGLLGAVWRLYFGRQLTQTEVAK